MNYADDERHDYDCYDYYGDDATLLAYPDINVVSHTAPIIVSLPSPPRCVTLSNV